MSCKIKGKDAGAGYLTRIRNVEEFKTLGVHVFECAVLLKDTKLIAKLSVADVIAVKEIYHAKCLLGLYNRASPRYQLSLIVTLSMQTSLRLRS